MSAAVVALVLAAPVIQLGAGSGLVLDEGLLVTTREVAARIAKSQATQEDGGTVMLLRSYDAEHGLALVIFSGDPETARLSTGLPDAGTGLTVATADARYDAVVGPGSADGFELTIADAGVVDGAALLDAEGRVWGVVRDQHHAVSSAALIRLTEALRSPPTASRDFARWRNLGISAVFFLGLCVWWVYRSKRLRY